MGIKVDKGVRGVQGLEGDGRTNAAEARKIMALINACPAAIPEDDWEANFLRNINILLENNLAIMTAKQVFKLRDIKDRMVERGVL